MAICESNADFSKTKSRQDDLFFYKYGVLCTVLILLLCTEYLLEVLFTMYQGKVGRYK